ncbi:hypothetical protein [Janibacter limosus]|uniref:Uncharacterized protein n=1 Tax=Janibacter limosus TaxID=53458 RepID=A0A4P6MXM2_9MICO|nr:hypothetical protein [Janibacter limosus]QBF46675.1 hypothetical protein EXU32_10690 [Janibacter limosus]
MTNVSRRHLAKGPAWAIPAVDIAASASSLSASEADSPGNREQQPIVVQPLSFAQKIQGAVAVPSGWPKEGYRLVLTVSPADAPAPRVTSVSLEDGIPSTVLDVGPVPLRPGVWEYVFQTASSPAPDTVNVNVSYTIGDGTARTATIFVSGE